MAGNDKNRLYFSDLLIIFMIYAQSKGVKSFPFLQDQRWHEFFFKIRETLATKFPALECIDGFDWNGPYPQSRDIIDSAHVYSYLCERDFKKEVLFLEQHIIAFYSDELKHELNEHKALLSAMHECALKISGFYQF